MPSTTVTTSQVHPLSLSFSLFCSHSTANTFSPKVCARFLASGLFCTHSLNGVITSFFNWTKRTRTWFSHIEKAFDRSKWRSVPPFASLNHWILSSFFLLFLFYPNSISCCDFVSLPRFLAFVWYFFSPQLDLFISRQCAQKAQRVKVCSSGHFLNSSYWPSSLFGRQCSAFYLSSVDSSAWFFWQFLNHERKRILPSTRGQLTGWLEQLLPQMTDELVKHRETLHYTGPS